MKLLKTLSLTILALSPLNANAADQTGSDLPPYTSQKLEPGVLTSVGSDTMGTLMGIWVDAYRKVQPQIQVQISSGGSAAAPAALIEGTADLGPMARPMKNAEITDFRARYGFEPTQIRTGLSAIAVYVPKSNPLKSITLDQLDRIYSAQRRRAGGEAIDDWAELGVGGALENAAIMPIGSVPSSTEYAYFRQVALMQGEVGKNFVEAANANALFETLALNPNGIGFAPLTAPDDRVRIVPVARTAGEKPVAPTYNEVAAERYPLSRYLSVYIVRAPFTNFDPMTKDFLSFILSRQGQTILVGEGLLPLPAKVARAEREKLQ